MRRLFLRPAAKADLRQIAHYSKQEWGVARAKIYLASLANSLSRLKDMPDLGVECSDLRAGYRRYGVGSHAIFYRLAPDRIEVVRILHQRMDAGRHLL